MGTTTVSMASSPSATWNLNRWMNIFCAEGLLCNLQWIWDSQKQKDVCTLKLPLLRMQWSFGLPECASLFTKSNTINESVIYRALHERQRGLMQVLLHCRCCLEQCRSLGVCFCLIRWQSYHRARPQQHQILYPDLSPEQSLLVSPAFFWKPLFWW